MLSFDRVDFEKTISLAVKKNDKIKSKWETKKLAKLITLEYGKGLPEKSRVSGIYPVVGSNGIVGFHNSALVKGPRIVIGRKGSAGKVTIVSDDCYPIDTTYFVEITEGGLLFDYCALLLKFIEPDLEALNLGIGPGGLNRNDAYELKVPIPPKNVQQKIIDEAKAIEAKATDAKNKIDAAKIGIEKLYHAEKKRSTPKKLSGVIEIVSGGTPSTKVAQYWDGDIPWLSVVDFNNDSRFVSSTEKKITEAGLKKSSTKYLNTGDLIISARGTVGALAQLAIPMTFNQSCYGLRGKEDLDNGFLYYALKYEIKQFKSNASGAVFDAITIKTFDAIYIPVPSPSVQKKVMKEIEILEKQILQAKKELDQVSTLKAEIFSKYL